ncbi:hypothetical protein LIER_38315 [Lithospermum erythrorhizon]|uniref:Uncharacterized protein n=1 Tax=Lithospermum erythrorhizon TaxID=34254 RepID=A0AAV3PZG3_LITER
MLTEFFHMNSSDSEAQRLNCYYKEFPRHFDWDMVKRVWQRRKCGSVIGRWQRRKCGSVIGRLATINPSEDELYYLRVLLVNVRCPLRMNTYCW